MSSISAVDEHSSQVTGHEPGQQLFSRKSVSTLFRALSGRTDGELKAADAASTLFRFFRSCHVVDLKLFLSLALIFLIFHFLVVFFFVLFDPAYHLIAGGLQTYGGFSPALRHCVDVVTASVVPDLIKYVGPAIPVCGAIAAWAYLSAATQLGVVDLFACEIRTVCRVGAAFDVAKTYIDRHNQCSALIKANRGDEPLGGKAGSRAAKGFVAQEDYFPVFTNNSHDLEALEATVVGHITEFYTYMKTVRDLQRKLAENEPAKTAEATYANLIYVLYLGHESARKAIKELVEFQPTRAENIMIILLTELRCFLFLCEYYHGDKLRYQRLLFRLADYKSDIETIRLDVKNRSEDNPDWGPAKRTLGTLNERYQEVLDMRGKLEKLSTPAPSAIPQQTLPPIAPDRAA